MTFLIIYCVIVWIVNASFAPGSRDRKIEMDLPGVF